MCMRPPPPPAVPELVLHYFFELYTTLITDYSSARAETLYRVEWVSPSPLGLPRLVSVVPLSSLCGGSRELLERCHALKWPLVPDANGSDSDMGRRAERSRDAARSWHYIGGEKLGCGTAF